MGWHALDNKHQVYENIPKKAFQKAQIIYGKRMNDAPRNLHAKHRIVTDFDKLIALRKERSAKKDSASRRFMFWIGFSVIVFVIVFLLMTMERLSGF